MKTVLIKEQKREYRGEYPGHLIIATVRYDDQCNNGHNTFSITGTEYEKDGRGKWVEGSSGCIHKQIAKAIPTLAPFIKWHLVSSDGPMHYIANTMYHAGDRDCHGLRKGESRQLRNGKSGLPSWTLEATAKLEQYRDAPECPAETATLRYVPWCRVGEGKERDLDAARHCAVWPDATDADLMQEPEALKAALEYRLPALLKAFKADMELLGFAF